MFILSFLRRIISRFIFFLFRKIAGLFLVIILILGMGWGITHYFFPSVEDGLAEYAMNKLSGFEIPNIFGLVEKLNPFAKNKSEIAYLTIQAKTKQAVEETKTNVVKVTVAGRLSGAVIEPSFLEVKKGDMLLIEDTGDMLTVVDLLDKTADLMTLSPILKKIPLSEIFSVITPSTQDIWHLQDKKATFVEVKKDGIIKFVLDYPDLFSDLVSETQKKEGKPGEATMIVRKITERPQDCGTLVQVVRPARVVADLVPQINVKMKEIPPSLKELAKKELTGGK